MFRLITALVLLIAFGAQTFQQAVIVLDYYVNTSAYSKNCENKAIPTMHCNGRCQMMKKLKQQEKQDQQNPERRFNNKNEIFSPNSFFAFHFHSLPLQLQEYFFMPVEKLSSRSSGIFHPPCV